jgi:hypothetical protein
VKGNQDDREELWLCSHLVSIVPAGISGAPRNGLLEEIWESGAQVGAEDPLSGGAVVALKAAGVEIRAAVEGSRRRENDYLIRLRFLNDYRWRPALWEPDHLYRVGRPRRR